MQDVFTQVICNANTQWTEFQQEIEENDNSITQELKEMMKDKIYFSFETVDGQMSDAVAQQSLFVLSLTRYER